MIRVMDLGREMKISNPVTFHHNSSHTRCSTFGFILSTRDGFRSVVGSSRLATSLSGTILASVSSSGLNGLWTGSREHFFWE